jgi:FG-GAP-like repeat
VIASPSTSVVRVLFSADLPGVTFLADLPDELVDVGGPGVDDVLLADVDGDDRNDLVALRTDGDVAVVRGVAGPPGGPFFDPASLAVFPAGAAAGAMAAGDLDCDGDLDLAVTAPTVNGIVPLFGNGNGTFVASTPTPAGNGPQDLALGDVDGDDELDIAVANDDGSFSIVLNGCGNFYPTMTPAMPIAMGKLCPGHPDAMAVAVGIFDIVFLTCGDGTGSFSDVIEPHGVEVASPHDYQWDPTVPGLITEPRLADLFVWLAGPSLYALRHRSNGTSEIVWLVPAIVNMNSGMGRTITALQGGNSFTEFMALSQQPDGLPWDGFAIIGTPGIGVTK